MRPGPTRIGVWCKDGDKVYLRLARIGLGFYTYSYLSTQSLGDENYLYIASEDLAFIRRRCEGLGINVVVAPDVIPLPTGLTQIKGRKKRNADSNRAQQSEVSVLGQTDNP